MARKEDSDIKIFKPSKQIDKDGGVLAFVEGMNHHRQNGNVEKAKELGAKLADLAFDSKNKEVISDEIFLSADIFPQVCALVLFSAEAALNYYLPSQQLSAIAINALHEVLSSKKLPVYDTLMSSPAFSFYYLSVRKGGTDIPGDIGDAFAMLCRHEEDQAFIEEGKKLYNKILEIVEKQILAIGFSN